MKKQQAFTMIELLVSATILIILTTLALVSFNQANISVRNGKRKADLETMRQALLLYRQDEGVYFYNPTVSFDGLALSLYSAEYLSESSLTDPKNTGIYVYEAICTVTADGNCYRVVLRASLEPEGTTYEITAL